MNDPNIDTLITASTGPETTRIAINARTLSTVVGAMVIAVCSFFAGYAAHDATTPTVHLPGAGLPGSRNGEMPGGMNGEMPGGMNGEMPGVPPDQQSGKPKPP